MNLQPQLAGVSSELNDMYMVLICGAFKDRPAVSAGQVCTSPELGADRRGQVVIDCFPAG